MEKTIKKNETCFIGMPSCGYGYESAKSCFVACPSQDKYTLKIEVIKDIIESNQYECHIALKKIDPGNFAFCTKICSKIIQSQFCIVLLDPSPNKEKTIEYPNPNVHFEYGMMLSQNKHIIPLQDENYDLAFNISPLDTIKYNDTNFKSKVTEAVANAISRANKEKTSGPIPQGTELLTFYHIRGYRFSDIKIDFFQFIYELGSNFGFFLFDNQKENNYIFFGPFDFEEPQKVLLHTKLLIDNIIAAYRAVTLNIEDKNELKKFEYLTKSVSIDIVIPPFYDKNEVKDKILEISANDYSYPIRIFYRKDIKKFVEDEYKKMGSFRIIKPD